MRTAFVLIMSLTFISMDQHNLRPYTEIAVFGIAFIGLIVSWRGKKRAGPKQAGGRSTLIAKDLGPVTAFVGGTLMYETEAPAIEASVQSRLAAERARRPNHASVALASCDENGLVEVRLYREDEFEHPVWKGVVGRLPETYVPKAPAWTFKDYERAEPIVNTLMAAALDET